jgi:hypothetical protein
MADLPAKFTLLPFFFLSFLAQFRDTKGVTPHYISSFKIENNA